MVVMMVEEKKRATAASKTGEAVDRGHPMPAEDRAQIASFRSDKIITTIWAWSVRKGCMTTLP